MFVVTEIVEGSPTEIWERFKPDAGIDESDYFAYYAGSENSVVFVIGEVSELDHPLKLTSLKGSELAPQSFEYLPNTVLELFPKLGRTSHG